MSDPTAPGHPGDPDATGATPPPASDDSSRATGSAGDTPASHPVPANGEPTQIYPPAAADAQPTQAYHAPGSDEPTHAYAREGVAGAPQQYPGQPGYDAAVPGGAAVGAVAYGGAGSPGGPVAKDTRPRTLALAALIAAVVGALLTLGGFIPAAGVATVLVVLGGILLLAGFVLALIALISKKQGGKGLGIAALVVSVLGGILFFFALIVSLVWIGLDAVEDGDLVDPGATSSAAPSQQPSEDASDEATDEASPSEAPSQAPGESAPGATGTYDEAAYLAAVRPEFVAILQEIQPGITEAEVNEIYSDETLVSIGQSFAALEAAGGVEEGRQSFVESTVTSSNGAVTEEQANRLFDTVSNAASAYLVQQ